MDLFKQKTEKPVVIAIHGFGKRRTTEMAKIKKALPQNDYEVILPELFNPLDESDKDYKEWIQRAEKIVVKQLQEHRTVYLVGFSMGGIIAAYLASIHPVEKLVLIAPAFEVITLHNMATIAAGYINNKKEHQPKEVFMELPSTFYPTLIELVDKLKECAKKITIPTLILQGTEDETIPTYVSKHVLQDIDCTEKALVYLEGGKHRVLDDAILGNIAVHLIDSFFKEQIVNEEAEESISVSIEV